MASYLTLTEASRSGRSQCLAPPQLTVHNVARIGISLSASPPTWPVPSPNPPPSTRFCGLTRARQCLRTGFRGWTTQGVHPRPPRLRRLPPRQGRTLLRHPL